MSAEGFLLTPWTAMIFFRYCAIYKINGESARLNIMRRIVAKKKARYLPHPEEFIQGKQVLDLRNKSDDDRHAT